MQAECVKAGLGTVGQGRTRQVGRMGQEKEEGTEGLGVSLLSAHFNHLVMDSGAGPLALCC